MTVSFPYTSPTRFRGLDGIRNGKGLSDLLILTWHCSMSGIRFTWYQSGERKRS